MSNAESQTTNYSSIQELVAKARNAQIEYESFNQEQVYAIVRDIGKFVFDNAEPLARMAVDETEMGSYDDKVLKNKAVEKIMNRFATYTGSSPYKTPAFMNQLAVVEMINGGYYPNGGIHSISKALFKLCKDVGVEFKFNYKIRYCTNRC